MSSSPPTIYRSASSCSASFARSKVSLCERRKSWSERQALFSRLRCSARSSSPATAIPDRTQLHTSSRVFCPVSPINTYIRRVQPVRRRPVRGSEAGARQLQLGLPFILCPGQHRACRYQGRDSTWLRDLSGEHRGREHGGRRGIWQTGAFCS
jgi:hypothetical protein